MQGKIHQHTTFGLKRLSDSLPGVEPKNLAMDLSTARTLLCPTKNEQNRLNHLQVSTGSRCLVQPSVEFESDESACDNWRGVMMNNREIWMVLFDSLM